jgi:hypothetical protein
MKRSSSLTLPIPVDGNLKTLIKNAAIRTRLSQAELMRTALRIGVPEVVERLAVKTRGKLFNLAPWPEADLARAYRNKKVDADYDVPASIRGQAFPRD